MCRTRILAGISAGAGLAAALGLAAAPAAGARASGAIYASNCSIAPATGLGTQLCPTGGQVVRVR